MVQLLVPYSGYRQDSINLFNIKRTQGEYDTQHKMPSGIAKDKSKDIDELTFGVNFYLTPNFVIKADYQLRDDASGSNRDDLFNVGIGWMF